MEAENTGVSEEYSRKRMADLLDFLETMSTWYQDICRMPTKAVIKFIKLGGKVRKLLGLVS